MWKTVSILVLCSCAALANSGRGQDRPGASRDEGGGATAGGTAGETDSGYGSLPVDQLPLRFSASKLSKIFALESDLNGAKFSEGLRWGTRAHAATFVSKKEGGRGFSTSPQIGEGEYSAEATVGFLSTVGLLSSTYVGLEVDELGSNPLLFYFLGVFWANDQLWAFAASPNGNVGPAVPLGASLVAKIRIVQTATEVLFYARAYKASTWLLVGTLSASPFTGYFQVGFGVNNLAGGATALIDSVLVWGALFGPAVVPFLNDLQGFYSDLDTIYCAMVIENELSAALGLLGTLLPAIDGMRGNLEFLGRGGQFLRFVLWANAIKFLASAYKSGMQLQQALQRGELLRALPAFFALHAYLRLADLALRGMAVKKDEDLRSFRRFTPEPLSFSDEAPSWSGPIPAAPFLAPGGLRG